MLDVRFLHNPHYVETLRPGTGRDAPVQEHIRADPAFAPFVADVQGLLLPLLPRSRSEGKSYLTIAFGCSGGRHRSVFLAELFGHWLRENGWEATTVHRDLSRATSPAQL